MSPPIPSSPRLSMKYVRKISSPSRRNALVPCHSSTPKSASKLSVMVYQGMSQPMRFFNRAISLLLGAGDEHQRGVAGVQVGEVRDLVGHQRAAGAAVFGPAVRHRVGRRSGRRSAGACHRTDRAGWPDRSGRRTGSPCSTAIRGILRRWAASASRARVSSFSLTSSSWRAAFHSCGETIGGRSMHRSSEIVQM